MGQESGATQLTGVHVLPVQYIVRKAASQLQLQIQFKKRRRRKKKKLLVQILEFARISELRLRARATDKAQRILIGPDLVQIVLAH
jgi:hypothetical protein